MKKWRGEYAEREENGEMSREKEDRAPTGKERNLLIYYNSKFMVS